MYCYNEVRRFRVTWLEYISYSFRFHIFLQQYILPRPQLYVYYFGTLNVWVVGAFVSLHSNYFKLASFSNHVINITHMRLNNSFCFNEYSGNNIFSEMMNNKFFWVQNSYNLERFIEILRADFNTIWTFCSAQICLFLYGCLN